jgi:intracellular sulfur oxidation DsrE/DsrF family protein
LTGIGECRILPVSTHQGEQTSGAVLLRPGKLRAQRRAATLFDIRPQARHIGLPKPQSVGGATMPHFVAAAAAVILLTASLVAPAPAAGLQDQAALSGLKEVKVAFDVTNGNGKVLIKILDVIDETRQSLIKQGVKPHFVIAFRGPATKLVQTDQSGMKPDDRAYAAQIAEKIKALHDAEGVASIEQCSVAVRLAGTKPENVDPGIKVVGNGWISLMSYQAKGYGYIAP